MMGFRLPPPAQPKAQAPRACAFNVFMPSVGTRFPEIVAGDPAKPISSAILVSALGEEGILAADLLDVENILPANTSLVGP